MFHLSIARTRKLCTGNPRLQRCRLYMHVRFSVSALHPASQDWNKGCASYLGKTMDKLPVVLMLNPDRHLSDRLIVRLLFAGKHPLFLLSTSHTHKQFEMMVLFYTESLINSPNLSRNFTMEKLHRSRARGSSFAVAG